MNGPFLEHNLTLAEVVRYMVATPLGVLQADPSLFDGVFADGTLSGPYPNMSQARMDALNSAIDSTTLAASLALHAVKPDVKVCWPVPPRDLQGPR